MIQQDIDPIAAFHTQRPGNYSICLSVQIFLATIFVMKTNQVLRLFSIKSENKIVKKKITKIKSVNEVSKFTQGSKY